MPVVRARAVWTPEGLREDVAVEVDEDGTIRAVREARAGDGPALDGLLVPGLVNGHTHLELTALHGRVRGGSGFLAWLDELWASGRDPDEAAGLAGAHQLVRHGTAFVHDVDNHARSRAWLEEVGLRGVVHHELLGFDKADLPGRIALAAAYRPVDDDVVVRPSPHAVFSTAPDLVVACVRAGAVPATIHVGEAEDEAEFLRAGVGSLARLLDRLGRDWRWWQPPGTGPLAYLDGLGVLGPDLLLVHGVRIGRDEIALAGRRGAPVCFCPRSNLHIGAMLPDVPAWLAAGVRACLGTDSLASNDDLDVLGEVVVLAEAFPDVPPERWLAMVTHEGAAALRARGVGRIEPGARPGLLLLAAATPADLTTRPPDRTWVVRP